MSHPHEPEPVKLIASIFSADQSILKEVINDLSSIYGQIDWESPPLFFDRTKYYAREMGWPLHRRFLSFEKLIMPNELAQIKLQTNDMEQKRLKDGNRLVNIDPGYVCAERLILATGKNYVHRVYLEKGIYADLTLIFKKGTFRPLEWTYKDYADPQVIGYFNEIRKLYMEQLRERRRLA